MDPATSDHENVALVTGGSRGIGRAIVESLLAAGWTVFFCSKHRDSVAQAFDALQPQYPDRVTAWPFDMGEQDQVDEMVGRVINERGRLDCLVNNAGVGHFAAVDQISGDDWRRLMRANLNGAFYAIRAAVPQMKKQGSGWIFNIASLAGKHPFAGGAAYNASKAGLMALSEAAMLDLRQHGIRVAAILPGSVETGFGRSGSDTDTSWKLAAQDVARTVIDLLRYPDRALPSLIELRPSRPPKR
jgi:NAD(P)-dependent dehydrogenase (short-subunit alcohol dehydrogenase family)